MEKRGADLAQNLLGEFSRGKTERRLKVLLGFSTERDPYVIVALTSIILDVVRQPRFDNCAMRTRVTPQLSVAMDPARL